MARPKNETTVASLSASQRGIVRSAIIECEKHFIDISDRIVDITALCGAAAKATGLNKGIVKKLAKVYFEQNLSLKEQEISELSELYNLIMGGSGE